METDASGPRIWDEEDAGQSDISTHSSHLSSHNNSILELVDQGNTGSAPCGRSIISLFRSVIMQALIDAMGQSKRTEDKIAKLQAIQWLRNNGKDFQMVCFFADLSPTWVMRKSQEAMVKASVERANHRIREMACIEIKHNKSMRARSYGVTTMS